MMDADAIVSRLETLIALTKLANRDALEAARARILSDAVNREILAGASKWVGAGVLQATVAKKTGASTRTVRDRLADLLAEGILDRRGGGPTTEYQSSGLL
jgi:Fic family protein